MKDVFISYHSYDQFRFDQLVSSLRETRALIKEYIATRHKFDLDHLLPKSFENNPRSFLIQKQELNLLQRHRQYIVVIDDPECHLHPFLRKVEQQEELYTRLLSMSKTLRRSSHFELRQLAKGIRSLLCAEGHRGLVNAIQLLEIVTKKFEKKLYKGIQKLRILSRRLKVYIKRDLRRGYRHIIHSLFKNMDDNSGTDANIYLVA